MRINSIKKQPGFTLIETTVALSILALVLAGVITLIISAINLNFSSREKTQAVALAQEGLAFGNEQASNNCIVTDPGSIKDELRYNNRFRLKVNLELGDLVEGGSPDQISFDSNSTQRNFVRVTSEVDWNNRQGEPDQAKTGYNIYTLTQYVYVGEIQ